MLVPQRQLLERIRQHAASMTERYPGYHDDMIKALADIIAIEKARPSDHVLQVAQRAGLLGDLIARDEQKTG